MNLKSEKGLSGVDMTAGIVIFMIGSVVIFNMYATLFSLSSKLKVSETVVAYVTEICEEIDYENYDDITEARVQSIIDAAVPDSHKSLYTITPTIEKYTDEYKNAYGIDLPPEKDLVKRINLKVQYSIDGQNRNYTVGKLKVKER